MNNKIKNLGRAYHHSNGGKGIYDNCNPNTNTNNKIWFLLFSLIIFINVHITVVITTITVVITTITVVIVTIITITLVIIAFCVMRHCYVSFFIFFKFCAW